MALLDIVLILLSVYLSMELRFEMYIPTRHAQTMFSAMPLVVAVYMACYVFGGIYQIMWRYAAFAMWRGSACERDCLRRDAGAEPVSGAGAFRGVLILIALMATIAVGGSRMICAFAQRDRISWQPRRRHAGDDRRRGRGGRVCRQRLQQKPAQAGQAVILVDDARNKQGLRIPERCRFAARRRISLSSSPTGSREIIVAISVAGIRRSACRKSSSCATEPHCHAHPL